MYLHSLATAVPEVSYSQETVWSIFTNSPAVDRLRPGSVELVRKVLTGENGIDRRHFALHDIHQLLAADGEALNRAFEEEAPRLGCRALENSLEQAGWKAGEVDGLVVCTCTGYLCPGLSSFIAERAGLRADTFLLDLVGQGCGAAIPSLRSAAGMLAGNPTARVAVVAVEVCTAAFYLEDEGGVLVSFCLFGDGAAASLWSGSPGPSGWRASGFDSLHFPDKRQVLRFENRHGRLRNRLHPSIPDASSTAVKALYDRSFADTSAPPAIVSHGGGQKVLQAVEAKLGRPVAPGSHETLRKFGNMSSPSVLFALEAELASAELPEHLWMTSFGAGFTVHGMQLRRG